MLAGLTLLTAAHALTPPAAPTVTGATGTNAACYWVVAANAQNELTTVDGQNNDDGDGNQTEFVIRFEKPFPTEPFVTLSSNQFAVHRLAEVAADHVTVAFREPPTAGQGNVILFWLAQE